MTERLEFSPPPPDGVAFEIAVSGWVPEPLLLRTGYVTLDFERHVTRAQ